MTLALWDLSGLIGGLLLVLVCQVLFMVCAAYFVVFRILGKNYDAAVMCAGLCGHGLGATPSAIVNMTAVCERYGMSSRAFMIVPIVGAFLVDIIYDRRLRALRHEQPRLHDSPDSRRLPRRHHLPAADSDLHQVIRQRLRKLTPPAKRSAAFLTSGKAALFCGASS